MSLLRAIRRHLSWKLFLSYLLIIVCGGAVLLASAILVAPGAFERHLAAMAARMGNDPALAADLFDSFTQAVTEAIVAGTLTALVIAIILGSYISRRVVAPIQEMMRASIRIADGHYGERVESYGKEPAPEELDELGRLATNFNRMATTLEQTEARRMELIGNVAHELRTPLSSIMGYMEGLMDGVLTADIVTFQKVHREADRLQRLVLDLEELSRVEAGAFTLQLHPVSVASLVTAAVDRLRSQFEDKQVALEVDLPGDLPPVRADEDRLGQVLLNLIGNALQYTPANEGVFLRAQRIGEMVAISVTDTGIGIAAEHLPRLFDRFYRVDNSRSRVGGGSGIGLTIARHLVEAHGGEISAASDGLGKGSTFIFTVPIA